MTAPGLVTAVARWGLTGLEPVAETPTSHVFRATDAGGRDVALKLLKPYGADEIGGARLLDWLGGEGTVRVLGIDGLAVLMEWAPGPPLSQLALAGRDAEATAILADVAAVLHRPRPGLPDGMAPLHARMQPLFETLPDWPDALQPAAARAAALARDLLSGGVAPVPLHGDLHHDNVIGAPRGWLAIDPKGLLGDPAYDLANAFRNPEGGPALALEPARIDIMARIFAERLGLPRQRLLGWAVAHCALSTVWNRQSGNSDPFGRALLPRLLAAHDAA